MQLQSSCFDRILRNYAPGYLPSAECLPDLAHFLKGRNVVCRRQHETNIVSLIPSSVAQLNRRRPSRLREAFDILRWLVQIAQKAR
jgi:hypothetical protein